jgi:hypothetical protein
MFESQICNQLNIVCKTMEMIAGHGTIAAILDAPRLIAKRIPNAGHLTVLRVCPFDLKRRSRTSPFKVGGQQKRVQFLHRFNPHYDQALFSL